MTTQQIARKRGKRYAEAVALIDRGRAYSPQEAVELVKKTARAKFDETVELHIRTNADPRHADQLIRGVVVLPHGTGKTRKVLAFVQGEAVTAARGAGADYIGDDETIKKIEQEGWVDFDMAVATPDMMGRIGRLGRVLGRRGLMPNPRAGTVVPPQDIPRVIGEAKKGRVEFRMDRTAIMHVPIGKASFPAEHLLDNMKVLVESITRSRPEGIKGQLVRTMTLSTSMGPGIPLDLATATELKPE